MSATVPPSEHLGTVKPPRREAMDDDRAAGALPWQEHGDVVVLQPAGQLDRAGVEAVREVALDVADRGVIIDLTDCVVTDPKALADIAHEDRPVDLCFVSRRPTSRLLLARAGVTSRFAVFRQLEDALQARTFAEAGFGRGWRRR